MYKLIKKTPIKIVTHEYYNFKSGENNYLIFERQKENSKVSFRCVVGGESFKALPLSEQHDIIDILKND